MTWQQAWALLREYNQEPFHLQHALTVEAIIRWFASEADIQAAMQTL